MDEAKNQINDREHKEAKNNQLEQQEEKRINKKKKTEDSVSSLWDNFKQSNIYTLGVPEGEETEQESGNVFEKIMKEKFLIW